MNKRIGFIGLGDMGVPMASRLADAGLNPLVWSRRPESAETVVARGAELAASLDELFDACDRIVLMLANAQAMDEVLGRGTAQFALRISGVTLIHMGTTPPGYSEALASDVHEAGGQYAEMPVSGSTGPAASGDLVPVVGIRAAGRALPEQRSASRSAPSLAYPNSSQRRWSRTSAPQRPRLLPSTA